MGDISIFQTNWVLWRFFSVTFDMCSKHWLSKDKEKDLKMLVSEKVSSTGNFLLIVSVVQRCPDLFVGETTTSRDFRACVPKFKTAALS